MVKVRLFAALREQAGTAEVTDVAGHNVGELADALASRFGERFAAVAAVSSYVVNGERAARSTPVADGDEVAILPPVSGGGAGGSVEPRAAHPPRRCDNGRPCGSSASC